MTFRDLAWTAKEWAKEFKPGMSIEAFRDFIDGAICGELDSTDLNLLTRTAMNIASKMTPTEAIALLSDMERECKDRGGEVTRGMARAKLSMNGRFVSWYWLDGSRSGYNEGRKLPWVDMVRRLSEPTA